MAVFYVWFPLIPDGGIAAEERMGLLTGIRKAGQVISFYSDKYSARSTSYTDKFSGKGTSYSDKYSPRDL